jgi:hypothetical protein
MGGTLKFIDCYRCLDRASECQILLRFDGNSLCCLYLQFLTLLLLLLWFGFLIRHISNVDCVFWQLFGGIFMFVQIWTRNGQNTAIVGKTQTWDRCVILVELAQSLLVLTVPNVNQTCKKKSGKLIRVKNRLNLVQLTTRYIHEKVPEKVIPKRFRIKL